MQAVPREREFPSFHGANSQAVRSISILRRGVGGSQGQPSGAQRSALRRNREAGLEPRVVEGALTHWEGAGAGHGKPRVSMPRSGTFS